MKKKKNLPQKHQENLQGDTAKEALRKINSLKKANFKSIELENTNAGVDKQQFGGAGPEDLGPTSTTALLQSQLQEERFSTMEAKTNQSILKSQVFFIEKIQECSKEHIHTRRFWIGIILVVAIFVVGIFVTQLNKLDENIDDLDCRVLKIEGKEQENPIKNTNNQGKQCQ